VPRRRLLLTTVALGLASLAGCSSETSGPQATDESASNEPDSTNATNEQPDDAAEPRVAVFNITAAENTTYLTNETITPTATVENTGNVTGTQRVELIYNGTVLKTEELELAPGDEHTITTEQTPETFELGTNEVTVVTEQDETAFSITIERAGPGVDAIDIVQHELVVEQGYSTNVYVEGSVANNANQAAATIELTVYLYDSNGTQTGRYTDEVTSLAANTETEFFVDILKNPDEFEEYKISVTSVEY
jgi:uncharacterized protein YcfL